MTKPVLYNLESITEVLALKSPAGGVGVHVLSTILKLTKTFIEMFKARHNPALSKVFEMLQQEKNGMFGQSSVNDNDRLVQLIYSSVCYGVSHKKVSRNKGFYNPQILTFTFYANSHLNTYKILPG